jgi:protein-L-isoaspartate(D-aspartate) O-methyltransferase
MVETLAKLGVTDKVVLQVMASVPRHRYVDRFWATPPEMPWTPKHVRGFIVNDDASDETLRFVYAASSALATRGPIDQPAATSSLSAPIIVALMLVELDLSPGLRVLEIGTGSGYHAVLMAMLVGDPACVTTVDIDQTLITETINRLEPLGFGAMTIRCVDGALGASDRAPFDRIVSTVGCADLSPAWIEQLAPGGHMLVPLLHGRLHPRIRVQRDHGLIGRFTGHSGFIPMQGLNNTAKLWPSATSPPAPSTIEALPGPLHSALFPMDPAYPRRKRANWNFATYLALRDQRADGTALVTSDAIAMLQDGQLGVGGSHSAELKNRLLEIATDWLDLGSPGLNRYIMQFDPRSAPDHAPLIDIPTGPWSVDRISYRQTVWLISP